MMLKDKKGFENLSRWLAVAEEPRVGGALIKEFTPEYESIWVNMTCGVKGAKEIDTDIDTYSVFPLHYEVSTFVVVLL